MWRADQRGVWKRVLGLARRGSVENFGVGTGSGSREACLLGVAGVAGVGDIVVVVVVGVDYGRNEGRRGEV